MKSESSSQSIVNLWIEVFQLDASVGGGKSPINFDAVAVALGLQVDYVGGEGLLVRDTAVGTLPADDTKLISAMLSQLPCLGV